LLGQLGYEWEQGPSIERDYNTPLYIVELRASLQRINNHLPAIAIDEAINKIERIAKNSLIEQNKQFTDWLQNGLEVSYFYERESLVALVKLIDFTHSENNSFKVINQWTLIEHSTKRADVIIFLNGLPLVVFELKSPSREETDASAAYRQLQNYLKEIPSLFIYNAFLVMSDLAISKAGTITAEEDRFMAWKTIDRNYEATKHAQFETFITGIFVKERLLDIIKNFICFSGDDKILGAYHQYFAVKKAIDSTLKAMDSDGRGGVFWADAQYR